MYKKNMWANIGVMASGAWTCHQNLNG